MIYLSVRDIVRINAKLIKQISPSEIVGIRDAAALDMAVNQPQQIVFEKELYPSIYDKAAILAINLAKRHPFQNANKRTALVAMITFFKVNQYATSFSREEAVQFIVNVVTSQKNFDNLKEEVTCYLKDSDKVFQEKP